MSTVPFMSAQRVLVMLFAYTTGLSFALTYLASRGLTETPAMRVASSFVVSLLIFSWYWFDSRARLFRRTPWLNFAVLAVAFVAIPYYLFRSRPPGQRARAFGNLCGAVALLIVSMIIGGLPASLL